MSAKRKVSLKLEAFKRDNAVVYRVQNAKNTLEFTPGRVLTAEELKKILEDRHPVDANYVDDVAIVQPKEA